MTDRKSVKDVICVGISGASGPIIGIRLVEELLKTGRGVHCAVSATAKRIIEYELLEKDEKFVDLRALFEKRKFLFDNPLLNEYENDDFFAPMASGSTAFSAAVVAPCSMKTLSCIVNGHGDSLIARMCDVAIKEKRKCVIVPRETPLSVIHLGNLLKAAQFGADILAPVPGFYTRPKTADDIIDFIVGKILNLLHIPHDLFESWDRLRSQ